MWFRVRPRPFWANHRAPIPARPRPRPFPLAQALRRSSPGSHGFLDLEFGHKFEFTALSSMAATFSPCCSLILYLGPPVVLGDYVLPSYAGRVLGCQG